ncbi:hypothetical protein ACFVAE_05040 [Microbacterium sp. NPDC057659]|uniref:hypothetical protein n=1 Tax=Microbacterium sp. NPDC057659 TaxID=3346198 RepID=UPI00366AF9BC
MNTQHFMVAGGVCLLLIVTAGCGAAPTHPDQASAVAERVAAPSAPEAQTSRVKSYDKISQLTQDSSLVVVATVSDEYTMANHGALANVVERVVHVERTLKGQAREQVIVLDLGAGEDSVALQPGTTHLFFLDDYELEKGEPTGQFVITGVSAGDYEQADDGSFLRVDTDSLRLPETLPRDFRL